MYIQFPSIRRAQIRVRRFALTVISQHTSRFGIQGIHSRSYTNVVALTLVQGCYRCATERIADRLFVSPQICRPLPGSVPRSTHRPRRFLSNNSQRPGHLLRTFCTTFGSGVVPGYAVDFDGVWRQAGVRLPSLPGPEESLWQRSAGLFLSWL